jgi:Ca2+-binding RTX toxin-like protein
VIAPEGMVADRVSIVAGDGVILVESEADPIVAVSGCAQEGDAARCPFAAPGPAYVIAWGDGGDDEISADTELAATTSVDLDGGPGDDRLLGSEGDDVLLAGKSGTDLLQGGAGRDALVASGPDGDTLEAGSGDDQLVADYPCGGHDFDGGSEFDIAGFAIARYPGVRLVAFLGGSAVDPGIPGCQPTRIGASNEILEGTRGSDLLYGNDADNPLILGRGGDDTIYGLGGRDLLSGDKGADSLFGGAGIDRLDAVDNTRDLRLDCRRGTVRRDAIDPAPTRCG